MSAQQDQLSQQLEQMIKKAKRSLNAARYCIQTGDCDFASSRAYYAIEAVLVNKNLSFSKHAGVIAALNQHFNKTRCFSKRIQHADRKIVSRSANRRLWV
ncbi:MAG: HEPN domain-containing protein [candidate division KSB1 bacterium]|nr:HEPN domain-containing protein [candidate division KSB1 bacterium]MDZ7365920.1 HEPN domain-containing protein [candidate division KSB1 bacterium]MDZ7403846.1 HEPN domain-containing protein [candidate division KSB1 bacterium]